MDVDEDNIHGLIGPGYNGVAEVVAYLSGNKRNIISVR